MLALLLWSGAMECACGGGQFRLGYGQIHCLYYTKPTAATPQAVTTALAQNGAVIVTLADTTSGAVIHYTLLTARRAHVVVAMEIYQALFLVSSTITVKAIATASAYTDSAVPPRPSRPPSHPERTVVWSDEFANSGGTNLSQRHGLDLRHWHQLLRQQRAGNLLRMGRRQQSLRPPPTSSTPTSAPTASCTSWRVIRRPASIPSARLKSQGLFSFMYGRIEAKHEGAGVAGHVAGLLAAGKQHRHHQLAGIR